MTRLKAPGASCPQCSAHFPAEYQQIGQPARWTCHGCGASGELTGSLTVRKDVPEQASHKKEAPPWARNLTRGR